MWLCQIAKHLLYRHWEKGKREIPKEMEEQGRADLADTEREALTRIELLEVLKEMQQMSAQMREVIYLRVIGDLSFREIGEVLGRSENWARVNFFRGKEWLLERRKEHE